MPLTCPHGARDYRTCPRCGPKHLGEPTMDKPYESFNQKAPAPSPDVMQRIFEEAAVCGGISFMAATVEVPVSTEPDAEMVKQPALVFMFSQADGTPVQPMAMVTTPADMLILVQRIAEAAQSAITAAQQ